MSKKLTTKRTIIVLGTLSVFIYAISKTGILLLFSNILDSLSSGKLSIEYVAGNKFMYFLYYVIADITPLLLTAIIIVYAFKRFAAEIYQKSSDNFSKIISEQQAEVEKQNKLINNLTNMYNDAAEYNRVKTEFFANISHELKTPLSVILGAIQLIDQKNSCSSNDKVLISKHFRTIKQNSYRLVRLINNLLDITRIDSGYIKMNLANCNIVYFTEEMVQSIAPYAEQKGLSIEFDTEFEEIITAVDIDKIERIILNLMSNAIKFTPSGGKVSVTVKGRNECVFISVKDTGPGIPATMQNLIFERYRQLNSTFTREFEGTGIGLALVKSFVELHDGNISIYSEEGKGSEFIIELPVKLTEENNSSVSCSNTSQPKIIEAINIEFSDIYSIAS